MGAELASPVTILVREPGRVTAGGGEPLVRPHESPISLQRQHVPASVGTLVGDPLTSQARALGSAFLLDGEQTLPLTKL